MKYSHTAAAALLCMSAAFAAGASAAPMDVKLGLWQSTITSEVSGMPPIDMSRYTPEQRARMEAAFQKYEAQGPRTTTYKTCLTKKSLAKDPFSEPPQDGETCTTKMTSQSKTMWQGSRVCTGNRGRQEYSGKITALSRERVEGTMLVKMSDGGHSMTSHAKYASKWLGSDCGDVK
ncbi:MAG: DUF3617 domain-containing protein [Burkholderiales bacterium]